MRAGKSADRQTDRQTAFRLYIVDYSLLATLRVYQHVNWLEYNAINNEHEII